MPLPIDREEGKRLFKKYRSQRDGIRNCPEMASVCLICESIDVVSKSDNANQLYCRNCGFAFYRYSCPECGTTVDGRDPKNPGCRECGLRVCICGICSCPQHDKVPTP